MFADGVNAHAARNTIHGLIFMRSLPGVREPMLWDAALLLAEVLLQPPHRVHKVLVGCVLLLQFDLYLCPCEVLGIVVKAVVRPTGKYRHWGVIMAPSDAGTRRPSKTGEWDDMVFANVTGVPRQVVGRVLRKLASLASDASPRLFEVLDIASYNREVAQASVVADLGSLRISPHCARHGGPSEDRFSLRLDLKEIARRGRWKCLQSVRRYEKHGRRSVRCSASTARPCAEPPPSPPTTTR